PSTLNFRGVSVSLMLAERGTLACFGASKILMSPTSELGPVDPQLVYSGDNGSRSRYSVFNVLKSYRDLFDRAVKTKGNLQPFLQQLDRYDAKEIQECQSELDLTKDISLRALSTGMMAGKSRAAILKNIQVFLSPVKTKSHGRAIYADEASKCGLNVEIQDLTSEVWGICYEVYIRMNQFCSLNASKCVETADHGYNAPPVRKGEDDD
ncbi:MAG: hypothetical protein AABZ94_09160, partial [Candidatus Eisenbacteria bacterium]